MKNRPFISVAGRSQHHQGTVFLLLRMDIIKLINHLMLPVYFLGINPIQYQYLTV